MIETPTAATPQTVAATFHGDIVETAAKNAVSTDTREPLWGPPHGCNCNVGSESGSEGQSASTTRGQKPEPRQAPSATGSRTRTSRRFEPWMAG